MERNERYGVSMKITRNPDAAPTDQNLCEFADDLDDLFRFGPIAVLWIEKCRGRRMPKRSDITARDMKTYLHEVQLFEVVEDGRDFLIRVMGTSFFGVLGYDPSGQRISELRDEALRDRLLHAARRVVTTGAPIGTRAAPLASTMRMTSNRFGSIILPFGRGGPVTLIESILLPLGAVGSVTHILRKVLQIHEPVSIPAESSSTGC